MPGITGFISADPLAAKRLDPMVSCLAHDGTYASGVFRNASQGLHVGWAVHRGSFSDCMPIWNEKGDVCLFLSGEVFTDPADLDSLARRRHRFDITDARHLVCLYEEHGDDFVARLNGWFSGLIVDLRQSVAHLFNDRYGVGRIYVREAEDGVYFSCDASSLLRVFPQTRTLDPLGVAETFSLGCVLQNRTLFKGIGLLPPGSIWTIGPADCVRRKTYFDPHSWEQQGILPDERFGEELQGTFSKLLPEYFRGPQAAAMSLTGGLDGRMMMAWARRPPGALPCYSFGSSYRDCEDVKLARIIAGICKQPHRTIVVGPQMLADFPELAARTVLVSGGTMDVSGAVEVYVNRGARKVAPVRLTGNYGSEILRANVALHPHTIAPGTLNPDLGPHLAAAARNYQAERAASDLTFIAFKQVPWHHHARLSVEQSQLTVRSPFLDNRLVALMYRASPIILRSKAASMHLIHAGSPELSRIPTDRGLVFGPPTLAGALRNVMREFMTKAEYAYDYGMPHWLAKTDRALSALQFERLFLGRQKFYHFRVWYRRQLAPYVRETLLAPQSNARSYFDRGVLDTMVRNHIAGSANHTLEIHRALTFELIHRQMLGPPPHVAAQSPLTTSVCG